MRKAENVIWLPEEKYPDRQLSYVNTITPAAKRAGYKYTVAQFSRCYEFGKEIKDVSLRAGGDTSFRLFMSGDAFSLYGPASITGDFLSRGLEPLPAYATNVTVSPEDNPGLKSDFAAGRLDFRAEVRMCPERDFELSSGHGGFCLWAQVNFTDGTFAFCMTDGSWDAKLLTGYTDAGHFDSSIPEEAAVKAEIVRNVWRTEDSPIPPCYVREIRPAGLEKGRSLTLKPGESLDGEYEFDAVIAGYVRAECSFTGEKGSLKLHVECAEDDEEGSTEDFIFSEKGGSAQCFGLHSAGKLRIHGENTGDCPAEFTVYFMASSYPVTVQAKTETSDGDLNAVLRACENNLLWCRQTLHLDSARHCEPLACTGDYYIETLMTAFSYGDLRLSAYDVRRTAEMMSHRAGRMFHTTYSLIWVQMLWDTYMYSGDRELLPDCLPALTALLDRFHGYLGENGLIETPPDYMFIDWLNPDGISMHHPPKALGQTCLCMYYFGALRTGAKIYSCLGYGEMAERCTERAEALKAAMLKNLWDGDRKLFFEGLNTPTPENMLYRYMPQNVEKRYYRRHANILAAYFDFFGGKESAELLERITEDESLGNVQPYFMHFWLEAVYRCGLRDKYTLKLLEDWKEPVKAYPKGIPEGFYKPEPTYRFDHSHAWGGTPLYSLPLALSGLEILEPGFEKIRLKPALLGLDRACVEIPAPQGMIRIEMEKGKEPTVTLPAGIRLV